MNKASSGRVVSLILAGLSVFLAFTFVTYLEFDSWFYNNEAPAYIRTGVLGTDDLRARQAFYEAARDACPVYHPKFVEMCERYTRGLLITGPLTRPIASVAGMLMTAISPAAGFMLALKTSIIFFAIAGVLVASLLIMPFLVSLRPLDLAAIVFAWIGGWIASRPLQAEGTVSQLVLLTLAAATVLLALISIRKAKARNVENRPSLRGLVLVFDIKQSIQILGIVLLYILGFWVHRLFAGAAQFLFLLLAIGMWPLLHGALPELGRFASGLLAAIVYVSAASIPFLYLIYEPKGQQLCFAGLLIFVALRRDDARAFWALPLLLLFDMQSGARISALIAVVEGLLAAYRRTAPVAMVPAATTVILAIVTMSYTAFYPFAQQLFDIWEVVGVLVTTSAPTLGLAAAGLLLWIASQPPARAVALDRMFVYGASIAAMAGLSIAAQGGVYDAFYLSHLFRSTAPAPAFAIVAGIIAMMLNAYRKSTVAAPKQSIVAFMLAVFLMMNAIKGRRISLPEFRDGLRASVTTEFPIHWLRTTPQMSLDDTVVYLDIVNLMTSPVMHYSIMKIRLLSKFGEITKENLVIQKFDRKR